MNTDLDRIKDNINKHMNVLQSMYNVDYIGVFGSFARGDSKETSDVDMLVGFSKPIGFFKFIELEEYLTNILGKKVDLVTEKALKPAIKDEVLREVIYV